MVRTVLIVDDDVAVAHSLAMALQAEGLSPTVANGAGKARTLLGSHGFDCILTDWRMPGEDGLHFVSDLCRRPGMPPAILMSAHISADTVGEAMAAGCVDVLPKPIDLNRLRHTLQRIAALPATSSQADTATDLVPIDRCFEPWNESFSLGPARQVDAKAETEPALAPVHAPPQPFATQLPIAVPGRVTSARQRHRRRGRRSTPTGLYVLACSAVLLALGLVTMLLLRLPSA